MGNLQEQLEKMVKDSLNKEQLMNQMNNYSKNVCPKCRNTGWMLVDDNGQGTAVECDCGIRKVMIHNNKLRFADIPESFKDFRLDNFKKSVYRSHENREMVVDIAKSVRYWFQNFEKMKERGIGLYFYSRTKGSGKTRLAASIANEIIEKYDLMVKFSTSVKILEEITNTWKDKEVSESKLIHDLSSADVFVIDDFGAEVVRGWVNEKFYSIIDGRYTNKKITIFTSNMSLDDLKYDDRIVSRLKERVLQIPFPEESVRELIKSQLKEELRKWIKNE